MAEEFELDPQDESLSNTFEPLVNGTYDLTIAEVPTVYTSKPGTPDEKVCLNVKYAIDGHNNRHTYHSIWLTKAASWRIAEWLNALGKSDKVSTVLLKSQEFRQSLVAAHLKADLGTLETMNKEGTGISLFNEPTKYVHAKNPPNPYMPGTHTVTRTTPEAAAWKEAHGLGSAVSNAVAATSTDTPLDEKAAAEAMAF